MKTGFLGGGDAAGALMRSHPWQQSPLGAVGTWPEALRTVVALMLNSQFPMFLLWGGQRVCLYNDGCTPILGQRHPAALARPMHEVWPEIWDEISPLIDRAYAGLPTFFENLPLQIERNGFQEQACFTFSYSPSYSPLRGPQGDIEGRFGTHLHGDDRAGACRNRTARQRGALAWPVREHAGRFFCGRGRARCAAAYRRFSLHRGQSGVRGAERPRLKHRAGAHHARDADRPSRGADSRLCGSDRKRAVAPVRNGSRAHQRALVRGAGAPGGAGRSHRRADSGHQRAQAG